MKWKAREACVQAYFTKTDTNLIVVVMSRLTPSRTLQLSLQAGAPIPCDLNWRVEEGYLRLNSWNDRGEPFSLGVWGPGELVMASLFAVSPLQLLALSTARVVEVVASDAERETFLIHQCQQAAVLLRLSRARPAEVRLFELLLWMGERFGRVNRSGVSLSLEAMNLTHRHLAELSGLTRVTVTKAMTHFRQTGQLIQQGSDGLLIRDRDALAQAQGVGRKEVSSAESSCREVHSTLESTERE